MKSFVVVISMWGNTGTEWVYTGNQYIMQELFTKEQCQQIVQSSNWESMNRMSTMVYNLIVLIRITDNGRNRRYIF